jgi:hypothetical protein
LDEGEWRIGVVMVESFDPTLLPLWVEEILLGVYRAPWSPPEMEEGGVISISGERVRARTRSPKLRRPEGTRGGVVGDTRDGISRLGENRGPEEGGVELRSLRDLEKGRMMARLKPGGLVNDEDGVERGEEARGT